MFLVAVFELEYNSSNNLSILVTYSKSESGVIGSGNLSFKFFSKFFKKCLVGGDIINSSHFVNVLKIEKIGLKK